MAEPVEIDFCERVDAGIAHVKSCGLILAAGASRRMGRPKALLPFEGETFLDRLIGVFRQTCGDVIVVLGHGGEAIRAGLKRDALFAWNPDPGRGQLSSMQCGLELLPPGTDAFVFTPVDYPAIRTTTVSGLMAALNRNDQVRLAIPRHEGRRGHPVACRSSLAAEFLNLAPGGQAREVVHRHADATCFVDVDDAGILLDIDDPQAYEQLLGARS
jgi:molybdenum cofactor cytidylyltransferase